jgi:hypothetical protein
MLLGAFDSNGMQLPTARLRRGKADEPLGVDCGQHNRDHLLKIVVDVATASALANLLQESFSTRFGLRR